MPLPDRPERETPRVFISYTHDDDVHRDAVREFATLLAGSGIQVDLDQWAEESRQDWYAWATRCIVEDDFVLVVASGGYRRMGDGTGPNDENRGGRSEAASLRDLLQADRQQWTAKILPVILPGHRIDEIPLFLQPYAADHYFVELTKPGIEGILRVLTRQPRHMPPPLGRPPVLAPLSGPGSAPPRSSPRWTGLPAPASVIGRAELVPRYRPQGPTVEVHLVPVDPPVRLGARDLRDAPGELARLGRERGLFTSAEMVDAGSSAETAWAFSTTGQSGESGLAVHRGGQRTWWFPLPRGTLGSVLDESDLVSKIAARLSLLADLPWSLPASVAPAIGLDPAVTVRLAPLSELSASTASFPLQPSRIPAVAEDAVASDDLDQFAHQIADELVARLVAALSR